MSQILVTINEDAAMQRIRQAIEMVKGVVSTSILKEDTSSETVLEQQLNMRESITRAFQEVKDAQTSGKKLRTADEFLQEFNSEQGV